MTEPIFRDLPECSTPQEAARWLLRCPLSDIVRDEPFIRRWLQATGFRQGLSYLDHILSVLREDRRDNGHILHSMSFSAANGRLYRVAEDLEPVGLGD